MTYDVLDVKPMTRRIGAEIFGVDLGKPLSNRQFEEVHQALTQYQVIFFRDQEMDHDAHKAFGRKFGNLAIHSGVPGLPEHPEIVAIHADANSKFVAGESWHSDLTCDPEPPLGSILHIKVLPEEGGDTCFASMYAAYETLSDKMKVYLEGLSGRARRQSGLQGDLPGHRPQVQLLGPPDRPHPSGQR
jgi:taurine dioxygenase